MLKSDRLEVPPRKPTDKIGLIRNFRICVVPVYRCRSNQSSYHCAILTVSPFIISTLLIIVFNVIIIDEKTVLFHLAKKKKISIKTKGKTGT
jgi:hypothetical protein